MRAPHEIERTEILDKRASHLPMDVQLTNQDGKSVLLGDYFAAGNSKPLILTLGYYKCPMLCSLVLNGLMDPLKDMSLKLGDDYSILSVSINPAEKADLAKSKQRNYLKAVHADKGWNFHVGSEEQVRKLADAVGFQYKYHKASGEYIHSAGVFILSPDGVLSRTFYGINYPTRDVKLALIDASHGKIGSLVDRVILSCFHYDPDNHKYGVYIFGVMRVGGLLTILIMGIVLLLYWRSERRDAVWKKA